MTCFEDYEYVMRVLRYSEKNCAVQEVLASARRGGGPRVSDRLRSHEGRGFRIYSEQQLAEALIEKKDEVSLKHQQEFVSRIYALGFRSMASGWEDHWKKCGEIAESIGVPLDSLGKRRKLAWSLKKTGGLVYNYLGKMRNKFLGNTSSYGSDHVCRL